MGDNADLILDGYLDEHTGEYLGEGQGFPRSRYHNRTLNNKHNANDLNTCMNFLRTRHYKTNDERFDIIRLYGSQMELIAKSPSLVAKHVRQSKEEWKKFKKFVDGLNKNTNE